MGFLSKIAKRLHVPTTQEREMAYLCESRNHYDLEFRQRQVDGGMFRAKRTGWY